MSVTRTNNADLYTPYLSSPLDSDELQKIEKKRKEKQELIKFRGYDNIRGKYIVEVHLNKDRSIHEPHPGILLTQVQSGDFGGGGIRPMYACANESCTGFISPDDYHPDVDAAYCRKCGRVWSVSEVFSHRKFVLSTDNWAHVLSRTVVRMGMDSDVKIVYFHDPVKKYVTDAAENKPKYFDRMVRSRENVEYVIYTLGRLLQDLDSGAEIYKMMYNFLTA